MVALDLSAAFDTIDHAILLRRLESTFGVSGGALGVLRSYLFGRVQTIRVGLQKSAPYQCTIGVPQGSVLGPLLFTAFISPVAGIAEEHDINKHQYADDTSLYVSLSSVDKSRCVERLEHCLVDVRSWFNQNGLALNPDKSEVLHVCPVWKHESRTAIASLDVAGSKIIPAKTLKCLGVTLDTRLNFDRHVQLVSANALYHIRALRHIRHSITRECARDIACAIIGVRLDYCNSLLHSVSARNLSVLQRVQNTAARIVTGAQRADHIRPHLRELHWLPIESRIRFKLATVTFRAITTDTPHYLAELINIAGNPVLRSSSRRLLLVPPTRIAKSDGAFSVAAPRIWNSLPDDVRLSENLVSFKSRLKTHLFRGAYL